MRLQPANLSAHLERPLLPVYLLSGDEPLQLNEAADSLRLAARKQGFAEREVLHVDRDFDWGELAAASGNLSLFASRRLIELRMPGGKPGDAGSRALVAYADNPPADDLLLIISGKLERAQQNSKWFKALDRVGAVLQVWPVDAGKLPAWIDRRLQRHGLQAGQDAVRLLAERVEGNMLAAAQEIDKLVLQYGSGRLSSAQVRESVGDSSRYDVFGLADAALGGETARCARILHGLRSEDQEPLVVLWALVREVRTMVHLTTGQAAGVPWPELLRQHRVWQQRQPLYQAASRRHTLRRWQILLRRAARLDRMCKGAEDGNVWDELLQFSLLMAGTRLV